MDLASLLVTGLFSALLGGVGAGLSVAILKPRLKTYLFSSIDEYIDSFLKEVEESPKDFTERLRPFTKLMMADIMRQFNVDPGENGKEPTIKLPIVGKVPVSFITGLLGQGARAAQPVLESKAYELLP